MKIYNSDVCVHRCCFNLIFIFQFDVQIHQRSLIFNLSILLFCNKVWLLSVKQKETLHLLTLGLHVTQNKFVTRILFIFHKSLMIPVIPAEWLMCMEMIKKLPVFVSHMYNCSHAPNSCIFIHVPQTMTFDWVLRVNQRLACQVIN